MYSSSYSPSASPYTSPPPPPHDPYRSSPIPVNPKQPYNATFSPPPQMPNNFAPMPSGQSSHRYQQYANPPQQYARAPPNRYSSPLPPQGYVNVSNGYPQQQQQPPPPPPPQRHKGTLAPGQIVKVGDQAVRIERYLSEGGYAHVYLTTSEKPIYPPTKGEKKGRWGEKGYTEHCLKRIAFEDDTVWIDVKKEIEVMKSLPPNPHLIQYLGSAHSRLPTGGHEVFILMEFCSGGGIIDLLNKRLRDRLKEIEILNIFTDVCEAVAAMHHLSKPLLHRDLKIENVLSQPISTSPTPQRPNSLMFKLCDFGSTTFPADKPPQSKVEADALAMDLNKHTTLQYRSPEMVEPMLGLPVGLPSDVWALGCLLYKLCYYTTPFEEHGPLAIVNAKYTFPPVPAYSPRIQHLIASMLMEQPVRRPTVFEILKIAHEMSGTKPEIDYPIPSRSLGASSQPHQPTRINAQTSNLLDFTGSSSPLNGTPTLQPSFASSVPPQRRGRPTREGSQKSISQPYAATSMPTPPSLPPADHAPKPNIQVTGEMSKPQSAPTSALKSSPGLDAFGMPSLPASSSYKAENRGFGDSFAAHASKTGGFNGNSRLGANLPRPPSTSGFGDSFGTSEPTSLSARSPGLSSLNRVGSNQSGSAAIKQDSPITTVKSPDSSSSAPNGESNFETRFPSLETLDSDHFSPPPQQSQPKPESLISPVTLSPPTRPTFDNRPSIMGNMTGGNLKSPMISTAPTDHPQPRSTQVTGTAFKAVKSPPSSQQKTDYFGSVASSAVKPGVSTNVSSSAGAKSPPPRDLMDDDQSGSDSLKLVPMQPGRSTTPLSASSMTNPSSSPNHLNTSRPQGSPASAQAAPLSGHHRPLLPHINSAKPNSNINSEEWSPLEKMRLSQDANRGEERKVEIELDSSDEDAFPEEASGTQYKPLTSPSKDKGDEQLSRQKTSDRASTFGRLSPTKSRDPIKSATVGVPPSAQSWTSGQRSRPQSMFVTPSSSSALSKGFRLSESPSNGNFPQSESTTRPSHGRKGSINDIVSKYENLKPPSASFKDLKNPSPSTSSAHGQDGTFTNGAKKPSIASKPQALRKSTTEQSAISPTYASNETTKNASDSASGIAKPIVNAKGSPLIAPKPVRHGETPRPEGFSRSSSGRAFPITKPKPSSINTSSTQNINQSEKIEDKDENGNGSGMSSPEKQQSVNSLIARWNQGQTANSNANKVVPKRGGYI
ncbi:uncharacterized protein I206_103287 [Kwoniella pini CBS 10737]|uniref:non-specific serine/threonine protein kinase n=1 Tax=Kwoniella pini CBS 10737 TaxID=1296096 RepID=A0A1B9IAC7_9TREE|nr:NAK protein kinase [Kwoniella pini CBS 10737]OCF52417.1 NAK protein kinase [Kwoniella pini CBS 10737]